MSIYKFSLSYKTLNFVCSFALIESKGKYSQKSELKTALSHADSSAIPSILISESINMALADCVKASLDIKINNNRQDLLIFFILVANIRILVIYNLNLNYIKH